MKIQLNQTYSILCVIDDQSVYKKMDGVAAQVPYY